ncbi:hypothetical protein DAEQUDRAFT_770994 [Daedalea quercina L-15889]|uniref:Uncharacterized protein n=1 Tax=Daedalea quercina L-15889 TaxID=1314783 RepID=A0A165KEY6_9APHY|nr:hypothetical protein DAEQUDRAFT_770994 [Daedalea quercina L-15889]
MFQLANWVVSHLVPEDPDAIEEWFEGAYAAVNRFTRVTKGAPLSQRHATALGRLLVLATDVNPDAARQCADNMDWPLLEAAIKHAALEREKRVLWEAEQTRLRFEAKERERREAAEARKVREAQEANENARREAAELEEAAEAHKREAARQLREEKILPRRGRSGARGKGKSRAQSPTASDASDVCAESPEVEIIPEPKGSKKAKKRKAPADGSAPDCDRCAAGYATPKDCVFEADAVACNQCLRDQQGCYWGAATLAGTRKARRSGKRGESEEPVAPAPPAPVTVPALGPAAFMPSRTPLHPRAAAALHTAQTQAPPIDISAILRAQGAPVRSLVEARAALSATHDRIGNVEASLNLMGLELAMLEGLQEYYGRRVDELFVEFTTVARGAFDSPTASPSAGSSKGKGSK